jgi:hypothetical protein
MSLILLWFVFQRVTVAKIDIWQIHISRAILGEEKPELSSNVLKLMHRFSAEQVQEKMDIAEAGSA